MELLTTDLLIGLIIIVVYLSAGFGFIIGYFSHLIKWRTFEKADFFEALMLMFMWIGKAYKLNKTRSRQLKGHI